MMLLGLGNDNLHATVMKSPAGAVCAERSTSLARRSAMMEDDGVSTVHGACWRARERHMGLARDFEAIAMKPTTMIQRLEASPTAVIAAYRIDFQSTI